MNDALSAFIVSIGLASSMVLLSPSLLKLHRQLRHSWFYGLWAAAFCYVLVVGPFIFLQLYDVAMWAVLGTTIWLATVGRQYPRMIFHDLRKHYREGRSMFEHGHDCPEAAANAFAGEEPNGAKEDRV